MKYPFVIFYRLDKYSNIDEYFINNTEKLNCTLFFTDKKEDLNKMFNANYQILITYGDSESEYISNCVSIITDRMRNRWIHISSKEIPSIDKFNYMVNYCFIYNCTYERENIRPQFSVFSSTYNSYDKIFRAYNSLKTQTFRDWEWVIVDDSPDDEHFNFLRKHMLNDQRIRLFRKSENNGSIGNVKNEAVSLCRGKYVLELDHDDEILPFVLQDSVKVFEENSDVGFVYMDCVCIYENGKNQSFGDFICKGYGGYYFQKYNNVWRNVYITPNINNITLTHLVCCPNHPRIWRKTALMEAGNYSELLPICDDYEIILRTALCTKIAKIHKFGYIQYMNESNNNFSLIRNGEINRIGPLFISPIFYNKFDIHNKMKELGAYEDESYSYNASQIWKRENTTYEHKYCNLIINMDYDKQYCILGFDTFIRNLEVIKELYQNPRNDFILLDNNVSSDYLCRKLDYYNMQRFKCYSLEEANDDELINYFMLLYKSCENYEIINNKVNHLKHNTNFGERHTIVNMLTNPNQKYIEIGVEYGFTFKNVHFVNEHKIGVDPDPKCDDERILKYTSDEFFENYLNNENEKVDAIFVDGMHHVEYVLKDINNSMKCLNENGMLFLDDILPMTYDEQLKIPKYHYYEKNILKYGEPWTGDVWKVMYYILENYKNHFEFSYYHHKNYRGVAALKIITPFEIKNHENTLHVINNYDYFKDYNNYIELIESSTKSTKNENIVIEI
jgi:glycosyltransferase involved in cell wall biosynthesis